MEPHWYPKLGVMILAGGKSSRMGRDKAALICPDGEDMLSRTERVARECLHSVRQGDAPIWVSGPQQRANAIPDRVHGRGPLSGLYSILSILTGEVDRIDTLLVLAVDMPTLRPQGLKALIDEYSRLSGSKPKVVHFEGSELPAMMSVESSLRDTIEQRVRDRALSGAALSLRTLFDDLGACTIPASPHVYGELFNMNHPEDYLHWVRSHQE